MPNYSSLASKIFTMAGTSDLSAALIWKNPYEFEEVYSIAEDHTSTVIEFARQTGANICKTARHTAFYDPREDWVVIAHPEKFLTLELYSGVLLHELAHWTKHPARLNRNLEVGFEEVVAQLTAAFLCSDLKIILPLEWTARYIRDHIECLKNWTEDYVFEDYRIANFGTVLKHSEQAAEYLHNLQRS